MICVRLLIPSIIRDTSLLTFLFSSLFFNELKTSERNPGLQSTEEHQFRIEEQWATLEVCKLIHKPLVNGRRELRQIASVDWSTYDVLLDVFDSSECF